MPWQNTGRGLSAQVRTGGQTKDLQIDVWTVLTREMAEIDAMEAPEREQQGLGTASAAEVVTAARPEQV